jgi:RNase P subunit RPR2
VSNAITRNHATNDRQLISTHMSDDRRLNFLMPPKHPIEIPPKKLPNLEAMERIHFLARAAQIAGSDPDLLDLAQSLGTEADVAAKKSVIRVRPKHLFCKKCRSPLVFPAAIRESGCHFFVKCQFCQKRQRVYTGESEVGQRISHSRFVQEVRDGKVTILSKS